MSHWYFPVQEPPSLSLGAERWEDSAWVLSGACSQPVQVTRGRLVIAHQGHQGMHRLHQSVLDTGGTHRVGRAVQSLLSPSPLWAVQTTPVAQVLGWDVWYWQMCRAPCQAQGQARADLGYSTSKEVKLSCAGTPWNTWGSPGIHADQGVNVWRAGLRRWSGAMVDERIWTCSVNLLSRKPDVSWAAPRAELEEVILPFCSALVRPHLEHGIEVWCSWHKKDVVLLQWVQSY